MGQCAKGFRGSDDDFVREVAAGNIVPTRVGLTDEGYGAELVMIEFEDHYGCQIHVHTQLTGEMIGHIKSNAGRRHNIYQSWLATIMAEIQNLHGGGAFAMTYRD